MEQPREKYLTMFCSDVNVIKGISWRAVKEIRFKTEASGYSFLFQEIHQKDSVNRVLLSDYVGDIKNMWNVWIKIKIGWIASPAKKEKVYEKENIYQKVICFWCI